MITVTEAIKMTEVEINNLPKTERKKAIKTRESWKRFQKVLVVRNHCSNPGLLKHDLRNPDRIRVSCLPPGEISSLFLKPLKKLCLNLLFL